MQQKSLVIILGAGTSSEVNLPVGSALKLQISKLLNIQFEDGYHQNSGDTQIVEAFRYHIDENKEKKLDINTLLHACWHICKAMPQAISIDNFTGIARGIPSPGGTISKGILPVLFTQPSAVADGCWGS